MNLHKQDWTPQQESTLLKLKSKRLTYLEIGEIMGFSVDALRNKYYRMTREETDPMQFERDARVLVFDIETSLMVFTGFRTGKTYLSDTNIVSDYHIISWAAKWLGEDEVFSAVQTPREAKRGNDRRVVKALRPLLDEADIVIGHNVDRFDSRRVNTRLLLNGISLPRPYKSIDTLKVARKHFDFSSNKLDYLCKLLGVPGKTEDHSYELWLECLKGNSDALARMEAYNINDVVILEPVYHALKERTTVKPPLGGWKREQ